MPVPNDSGSMRTTRSNSSPFASSGDLHVPVHRRLARAAGRQALGVEAVGQVGDRAFEALRDGCEVPLVVGDQRRVCFG